MKVELNVLELEYLNLMTGGHISPSLLAVMHDIKRNLLLAADAHALTKHECAIVVACHNRAQSSEPAEPPVQAFVERVEEQLATRSGDLTPSDEITVDEKELLERQNMGLNPVVTGGEYLGPRIPWRNDFTSTPNTPVSKLEYGRPITYLSPKDGREWAGRFVRVNRHDPSKANVMSSEQKKAFSVPIQHIRIVDLSRPSTEPRAVQI